jgi:uncharacterized protein Usg
MAKTMTEKDAQATQLLRDAGSNDVKVASEAKALIAQAITEEMQGGGEVESDANSLEAVNTPIREGVLDGDIVSDIFMMQEFDPTQEMRIPIDLLSPGTEKEHKAYVMPDHGSIPQRRVEMDYILLNTYQTSNSIDCTRRLLRNGRADILRRMIEVLRAGFVKKDNDDGWQTILGAADGRGIVVFDPDAEQGQFTPRLVKLAKDVMRRNGGGNSNSLNRKRLTDVYLSPEGHSDMTTWGLNLIPDDIRSDIHRSADGGIGGLYGVNFHDIDEFGVNQEFQQYWDDVLDGDLASGDVELAIGLDLSARDKSFINPITEDVVILEDNTTHREGLVSFYGTKEAGWAVLDTRYVLAMSF